MSTNETLYVVISRFHLNITKLRRKPVERIALDVFPGVINRGRALVLRYHAPYSPFTYHRLLYWGTADFGQVPPPQHQYNETLTRGVV